MSYYTVWIVNFLFIVLVLGGAWPSYATDLTVNPGSSTSTAALLNPPSSGVISTIPDATTPAQSPNAPYQYPFADGLVAENLQTKLTVIELFNALDCPFCGPAEQLIADITRNSPAITLICDTEVEETASPLARAFCIARQERYGAKLSDGLVYTPQLIINGHIDAVGHKFEDVRVGLNTTATDTITKLDPRANPQDGTITLDLPTIKLPSKGRTDVFAITYRPPYKAPVATRQSITRTDPLVHVANRFIPLGTWDGAKKTLTIPFITDNDNEGLIVMVQDEDNNIIAAGEWPQRRRE